MFRNVLPVMFGLIFAIGLSQFPEFAQQYTQRVGGARTEVLAVVAGFRADAEGNGKTVEEAIAEYKAAEGVFFAARAASMELTFERLNYLERHYSALAAQDGFEQLVVFLRDHDLALARDTLSVYRPAVPVSFTGFAHAALGLLFGYFLFRIPAAFGFRRRTAAPRSMRSGGTAARPV